MITVYRIVKTKKRAQDLTGTGAFKYGGRWNNMGTYMLYTSENISLAYLETLVHVDENFVPADLFIIAIAISNDELICNVNEDQYPGGWQKLYNKESKETGDRWMLEKKYLGYKIKSAINLLEYNYLLNPLFPGYNNLVQVSNIFPLVVDLRLIR